MSKTPAWPLIVALALPSAAGAQASKTGQIAQATQNTSSEQNQKVVGEPPVTGTLPPVAEPPPPSVIEPPPAPPTIPPAFKPRKKKWTGPTVIALEAGALGFAVASIVVISTGSRDDTYRVPLAAGLGGGFIACAGVGFIIGLVVR